MTMTAVSLFSGIGGFELGLARAGVRTVASVEIDDPARGVIADRFPDVRLFTDIRKVTGHDLIAAGFDPRNGIVTAGWPCQGNSVAGRRGGMDDPRSGLWREVVRLLAELRPAWFFGENVPGLLQVNGGRDFGTRRRGPGPTPDGGLLAGSGRSTLRSPPATCACLRCRTFWKR